MSPQAYFQEHGCGQCIINAHCILLTLTDGSELQFPHNTCNNLPMMLSSEQSSVGLSLSDALLLQDGHTAPSYMTIVSKTNQNLTQSQNELLTWHWKLGHTNVPWIQDLCHDAMTDSCKILPTKCDGTSTCNTSKIKCAAYLLGKQTHCGVGANSTPVKPESDGVLKANNLHPWHHVSLDQFQSTLQGHLPHTKGKEHKKDHYNGGTLFIDHASRSIYMVNHVSLHAGETLQAWGEFESLLMTLGSLSNNTMPTTCHFTVH